MILNVEKPYIWLPVSKNAPEKAFIFRKEVRDEIDSVMNTIMDRLDDYRDFPSNYSEPAKKYRRSIFILEKQIVNFTDAGMLLRS